MAIKSSQIIGVFTVFSDFKIDFCDGVNILIGANGVGKTQLLKLIYTSAVSQERQLDENMVNEKISMSISNNIIQDSISSVFDVEAEYMKEKFVDAKFSVSYDGLFIPSIVFIPAKEMLSHAKGLLPMKKKYGENMPFDVTLLDVIEKAQAWKLKETPELAKSLMVPLEKVMGGTVEVKDDGSFWMKKQTGELIPFSLEAEGLKKFGLLWQLLVNESITSNSIVLWDEPEASINPGIIPILVDIILELQRNGVQIIAATHSYNFARYFDILRKDSDRVSYYCLYKSENGFTQCSQADSFVSLLPNPIDDAGERLYNETIKKAMEDL